MAFTVTTLIENTSSRADLAAEHGLSMLIEGNGVRILYDTGSSPRFLLNARALHADLSHLDALVLSHGHYDHTGGASALLARLDRPAALYVGEDFFAPRYASRSEGYAEISSTLELSAIQSSGIPLYTVGKEPLSLGHGLWLASGFSTRDESETLTSAMLRETKNGRETDLFQEELAVVLELQDGLALLSGCAHVGILSICQSLEEHFGKPVTAFIGGTHLVSADEARIRHTCKTLKQRGMKQLGACHCTGDNACQYFQGNFPGFFRNQTGSRIILE